MSDDFEVLLNSREEIDDAAVIRQVEQASVSERIKTVNLSYNNLTQLPDEIKVFTQLEALDLGGNNFTEIPEIIAELPDFESLDLEKIRLS